MAVSDVGKSDRTCKAGASLAASQYLFCEISAGASGNEPQSVTVCNAATDIPYGVIQDKAASGDATQVRVAGYSKVVAGATIAAGDLIGTDNAGKAVPLVAGTDTTKYVVGRAVMAGVSGDIITVDLACIAPHRAA